VGGCAFLSPWAYVASFRLWVGVLDFASHSAWRSPRAGFVSLCVGFARAEASDVDLFPLVLCNNMYRPDLKLRGLAT
jgi:hypothetical protein